MLLTSNNLYHPFRGTLIGIFNTNHIPSDHVTGFLIEDIDLYSQPALKPIIATIFLVIMLVLLCTGEYLHYKVFVTLKRDKTILRNISIVYISAQMMFWPISIFLQTTTNFINPLNIIVGQWFCTFSRFAWYFLAIVVAFHSFIAAVMRYCFIIHATKVNIYGKEKLKKLFLSLSVLIPFLLSFWKVNDGSDLDAISFINKCYGKHHKSFLIETSTLNVFKKTFCQYGGSSKIGVYGQLIAILTQISCIACTLTMIITMANITEGVIYFRLFSHLNR